MEEIQGDLMVAMETHLGRQLSLVPLSGLAAKSPLLFIDVLCHTKPMWKMLSAIISSALFLPLAVATGDRLSREASCRVQATRSSVPSRTNKGPLHQQSLLPTGEHLAVLVWSDRCPCLGPAGEPAISP